MLVLTVFNAEDMCAVRVDVPPEEVRALYGAEGVGGGDLLAARDRCGAIGARDGRQTGGPLGASGGGDHLGRHASRDARAAHSECACIPAHSTTAVFFLCFFVSLHSLLYCSVSYVCTVLYCTVESGLMRHVNLMVWEYTTRLSRVSFGTPCLL